ncbi:MAG: hypothetical protein LBD99_06320 [Candidatus Margulisbacteria bacterium]|jgi:hypothetical protein|nr:hypothetical protein [Candidatus Margulisiibacteriota bacterium]
MQSKLISMRAEKNRILREIYIATRTRKDQDDYAEIHSLRNASPYIGNDQAFLLEITRKYPEINVLDYAGNKLLGSKNFILEFAKTLRAMRNGYEEILPRGFHHLIQVEDILSFLSEDLQEDTALIYALEAILEENIEEYLPG